MKLLKMLVGRIRDWRSRRVYERLSDEAVEEQLNKLTDNKYLDRFSGGSRGQQNEKDGRCYRLSDRRDFSFAGGGSYHSGLCQVDIVDRGAVKMGILTSFTIPHMVWISEQAYRLVNADIDGKRFNLRYESMPDLNKSELEFTIGFETFYSPSDKDVEEEFTKRLELLGGTIEDPND